MSGLLLELRGGHMVVFQVKVLQVAPVRQLVDNVSECFTFCVVAPNRGLPLLARGSPLTPLVPVLQLDLATLGVPFSSVAVWPEEVSKVSEELEVQGLRHQWLDHVLLDAVPFLLSDVQEVCHPHLHLHACLVHERDVLVFALTWQRLHVSLGEQIDYLI